MKTRNFAFVVFFFSLSICSAAQEKVIKAGQIIDGTGRAPIENGVVVVRGDTIEAVGPASRVTIPLGAKSPGDWIEYGRRHYFDYRKENPEVETMDRDYEDNEANRAGRDFFPSIRTQQSQALAAHSRGGRRSSLASPGVRGTGGRVHVLDREDESAGRDHELPGHRWTLETATNAAGTSMGLGSTWIARLARVPRVREILHIPEGLRIVSFVALGIAANEIRFTGKPPHSYSRKDVPQPLWHYGTR